MKTGEVNPEIELTKPASADEAVFSDMGGMEKPVDLKVQPVKTSKKSGKGAQGQNYFLIFDCLQKSYFTNCLRCGIII